MTEQRGYSFLEIVNNKMEGKWCDGICLLEVTDNSISVTNIYDRADFSCPINEYEIFFNGDYFFEVQEVSKEEALRQLLEYKKRIKAPMYYEGIYSEDIPWECIDGKLVGGDLISVADDGEIVFNDNVSKIKNWDIFKENSEKKWLVL